MKNTTKIEIKQMRNINSKKVLYSEDLTCLIYIEYFFQNVLKSGIFQNNSRHNLFFARLLLLAIEIISYIIYMNFNVLTNK